MDRPEQQPSPLPSICAQPRHGAIFLPPDQGGRGFLIENLPTKKKKWFSRSKPKGDRGFIEGCLFALCCCWIYEMCF